MRPLGLAPMRYLRFNSGGNVLDPEFQTNSALTAKTCAVRRDGFYLFAGVMCQGATGTQGDAQALLLGLAPLALAAGGKGCLEKAPGQAHKATHRPWEESWPGLPLAASSEPEAVGHCIRSLRSLRTKG